MSRNGKLVSAAFVTGRDGLYSPDMPARLAARVYEATWPAVAGEPKTALKRLLALDAEAHIAAVCNNLGVIYETRDEMGPAIRRYQRAARLNPSSALYRYNLGIALKKIGNFQRSVEELGRSGELMPNSEMIQEKIGRASCRERV